MKFSRFYNVDAKYGQESLKQSSTLVVHLSCLGLIDLFIYSVIFFMKWKHSIYSFL